METNVMLHTANVSNQSKTWYNKILKGSPCFKPSSALNCKSHLYVYCFAALIMVCHCNVYLNIDRKYDICKKKTSIRLNVK